MKREPTKKEIEYGKFIVQCRHIRLHIGKNPGCATMELIRNFKKVDLQLGHMLSMKIIRYNLDKDKSGRRVRRWFVIPQ